MTKYGMDREKLDNRDGQTDSAPANRYKIFKIWVHAQFFFF